MLDFCHRVKKTLTQPIPGIVVKFVRRCDKDALPSGFYQDSPGFIQFVIPPIVSSFSFVSFHPKETQPKDPKLEIHSFLSVHRRKNRFLFYFLSLNLYWNSHGRNVLKSSLDIGYTSLLSNYVQNQLNDCVNHRNFLSYFKPVRNWEHKTFCDFFYHSIFL